MRALRSKIRKDKVDIALATDSSFDSLLKLLLKGYPKLKPLLKGEARYKYLMILNARAKKG